jgi:hypothetical protein
LMTGQSNPSGGKSPVSSPALSLRQRDLRGLHGTVLNLRAASAAWSDCGAAPCSIYLANERACVLAPTPRPRLQRPPLDVNSPPQPAGSQPTTCGQPSAVLVARLSGCQAARPHPTLQHTVHETLRPPQSRPFPHNDRTWRACCAAKTTRSDGCARCP